MATDVGIKLKIEGEKEYKQSLASIIQSQKEWESEIKAVDSALESETKEEEKNRKKKELLTKSIESQEEKLGLMREQLTKVEEAYGEDSRQAKALRTQINKATTALNKMKSEAKAVSDKMKTAGKSIQDAGKKMQAFGDSVTKYVSAPVGALAGLAVAAFNEVDAGLDIVTVKTGATGEALADLQQSTKNLATSMPTDFETAGSAIGAVNTRFGLTGEELESLSGQFIKFAELNNTDVSSSVEGVQKVMAAFGVETKDAGKLLDAMNATGQATGISMDTLQSTMLKNAAALSQMGLDAESAAGFLGKLETSGAPVETVMKGLQTAMNEAAEDGMTLPQKLEEFQAIMSSSASETDKLQEAVETFGKKAGPAIYQACKEGSLSFEDLYASADEYLGNIETTFDNTLDAPDRMQQALNKVKIAGSDIGGVLLDMAVPAIETVAGKIEDLGKWFDSLDESGQQAVGNVAAALIVGGPAIKAGGSLLSAVGTVVGKVGELAGSFTGLGGAASVGVGAAAIPLAALASTVGLAGVVVYSLTKDVETSNETINELVATQKGNVEALGEAMEGVKGAIDQGNTNIEAVNTQAGAALTIVDELEKLESQSKLTATQEARRKTLIDELNQMYPDLKVNIDESTGSLTKSTGEIKTYIKQAKKIALVKAYTEASQEALTNLVKAQNALYQAEEGQKALEATAKGAKRTVDEAIKANKENAYTFDQNTLQAMDDAATVAANAVKEYAPAVKEAQTAVDEAQKTYESWEAQISGLTDEIEADETALNGQSEAADGAKESVDGLAESTGELGAASGDAADEVDEAAEEIKQAWADAYNSAYNSLGNSAGVFEAFGEQVTTTAGEMAAGLHNQLDVYTKYNTNLAKAIALAGDDANSETAKVVQAIIDMGIDGAEELDALVKAADADSAEFHDLIATFGDVEAAKELAASQVADYTTGVVEGLDVSEEAKQATNANYEAGAAAVEAVSDGAASKTKDVETAAGDVAAPVADISDDIDASAKDIKTASSNSVLGMIGGMILNKILLGATAKSTGEAVGGIATAADAKKGVIKTAGLNAAYALRDGMQEGKSKVSDKARDLGLAAGKGVDSVRGYYESYKSAGAYLAFGIGTGMDSQRAHLVGKAAGLAKLLSDTINNSLKIKSPSRVTMETGRFVGEGLALGMEKEMGTVQRAATTLSRAAVPFGATGSDVVQIRAEAFGDLDVDGIYNAIRSGAMDGQQPVIISEKSFKRALVGMGVKIA
jgi:phage-related minor tail protein/uncharacterized protein YoxC